MNIRFVSSLTAEDEVRLAESLLIVLPALLDKFAIAYMLKIEAGESFVVEHHHSPGEPAPAPVTRLGVVEGT